MYLFLKLMKLNYLGLIGLLILLWACTQTKQQASSESEKEPAPQWTHLSTTQGDLEPPNIGNQQTASLVADLDKDGINDFMITERTEAPSVVWYRRTPEGWDRYVVDDEPLHIEAGSTHYDIDGDGDEDVVFGGDGQSNQVWWWENPYPEFDPVQPWKRHLIKDGGVNKHHDQLFGDFDGDGKQELVFWNQNGMQLVLAEIPENPREAETWEMHTIYTWSDASEIPQRGKYPGWKKVNEHEGLDEADMNDDGKIDIVGAGRWFEHIEGYTFKVHTIDESYAFSRSLAAQFISGGRPEVVLVAGDGVAPLMFYTWNGNSWDAKTLTDSIYDGHSISLVDFNDDGNLDIFNAEMGLGNSEHPKARVFLGDGTGNFTIEEVLTDYGLHESVMTDLDGDGDLDILGKPYTWKAPRLDIWLNNGTVEKNPNLSSENWERHLIDPELPKRAMYIQSADIDGDEKKDIVVGGTWYKNPGNAGGTWETKNIGAPLNNMAVLYDFDKDGDIDVFGTEGVGAEANADFVWAKNDGKGTFTILDNIEAGKGDFLQGVTVVPSQNGTSVAIALSWHRADQGVQLISVPEDPSADTWTWRVITENSLDEDLSTGDIDGDGDIDLFQGTQWLENPGDDAAAWTSHVIGAVTEGEPDRNDLYDFNKDGSMDAVVGLENGDDILLYLSGNDPTQPWHRKIIATGVGGGFSMDAADMDGDGDVDVILGEHRAQPNRLIIYENINNARNWFPHIIDDGLGDETIDHHDGSQAVDIDDDGDLDIISVGWYNPKVWIYENKTNHPL